MPAKTVSPHRLTHYAHVAMAVSLFLCAVFASYALVMNTISLGMRNILFSVGMMVLLSVTASKSAQSYEQHGHVIGLWGLCVSVIAFLASVIAIWDVFVTPLAFNVAIILVNFAIALTHLCIMLPVRQSGPTHPLIVQICASATMIATVCCAVLVTGLFAGVNVLPVDGYLQLIFILIVLTLVGSAITPILIRIYAHSSARKA